MQYDANGIRHSKVVPGTNYTTTTEFLYDGNKLLQEKVTLANQSQSGTTYKTYLYNSQGIIGFVANDILYSYRKNLFGDITAIYQGSTKVAEYAYDAFGNCTIKLDTNGIGSANPFRYRGYYWDSDLNLYYLMSRYYDPLTGRFISPIGVSSLNPRAINGLNLYSYATNNPIFVINKWSILKYYPVQEFTQTADITNSQEHSISKISSPSPITFSLGLITPDTPDLPPWLEVSAYYIKGGIGFSPGFSKNLGEKIFPGLTLASLEMGIISTKFDIIPIEDLGGSVYVGLGSLNASASIGLGVSASIELLTFNFGVEFEKAVSLDAKIYFGWGISIDFSKGIKLGVAFGAGFEISISF